MKIRILLIFLIYFFTNLHGISFPEFISLFKSEINLNKDRSMNVKETIVYQLNAPLKKRGIFRQFPTKYKDRYGNNVIVDFKVKKILKDGLEIPYKIEDFTNGKVIKIGDPNKFIEQGKHVYTIEYKTDRQLGFFSDFDELAWNVTGTDSPLYILKAVAIVTLPTNIPINKINLEAYTGYKGAKEKNYNSSFDSQARAVFQTTQPLKPHQNITIVITWPKGYIQAPTLIEKIIYLLKDNFHIIWLLIGLIILLSFYFFIYVKFRKSQQPGIIIPLFYPPDNFGPGSIGFIKNMKYSPSLIAAEIVNLAVKGCLTIEYQKGFLSSKYILKKKECNSSLLLAEQNTIYSILFKHSESISLDSSNNPLLISIQSKLSKFYNDLFSSTYFEFNTTPTIVVVIGLILWLLLLYFMVPTFVNYFLTYIILGFYIFIILLFVYLLKGYSQQGKIVRDKIDGFQMFLQTTETERLKMIGTPPTKTPELFETYLPYAMVLGVDKQWTQQFAPIFAKFASEDRHYQPHWITGITIDSLSLGAFTSEINSSLTSVFASTAKRISSSTYAPGTYTSSGGRGSSGSGGGGGGTGSW